MSTNDNTETPDKPTESVDFIRSIVAKDVASNKHGGHVVTRFPPEPNGYLHIGHAKSICLNFGIAAENNGKCHLRFDDTDPTKEDVEYVESIQHDVKWLGFDWGDNLFHASDYFPRLYDFAVELVKKGKAYVCDLSLEHMRMMRGTVKEPGQASPNRDRSVAENLDLFARMRNGEFDEGSKTLRAKIDMAHPNMLMRDPPLYRIRKTPHYRQGDKWCIYPMYDFTHCLSDSLEDITHSICTLEFENNRAVYDWVLDTLETKARPHQYEFARLNLSHTVMSKRKLLQLVREGLVDGWDDPRMPTIAGLRRRGVTPEAIRTFCEQIGVAKANSMVDLVQLEFSIRDDLNRRVPRVMAVLRPLKVVIDNYPAGDGEDLEATNYPDDPPKMGSRKVPFSKILYIEESDFMEDPPKKFFRLAPGQEVRLRWAYLITCTHIVKDDSGKVIEVHCSYDPETRGGNAPEGRKVKGTIHWVSAQHAVDAEIRLYDRLFSVAKPDAEEDFKKAINPDSLETITAKVERSLRDAKPGERFQFERQGYFCRDSEITDRLVFNRTVALRDSWAKMVKSGTT
ncbi:MAG: glutamine--tRNA ligase [Deltaproteobacteria bacterium RIFOXYA12_FULL_58_15]|nr:MAG: glutamine--tRNA ligase [Deltaproteobacteria bacterium RIFOXYA12_FULL_58_15]OGR07643.1 MAG: glutamine--tRNA ligase [Deltaproteobacteria bacterium RIFOXYB12_FULL_58_9]